MRGILSPTNNVERYRLDRFAIHTVAARGSNRPARLCSKLPRAANIRDRNVIHNNLQDHSQFHRLTLLRGATRDLAALPSIRQCIIQLAIRFRLALLGKLRVRFALRCVSLLWYGLSVHDRKRWKTQSQRRRSPGDLQRRGSLSLSFGARSAEHRFMIHCAESRVQSHNRRPATKKGAGRVPAPSSESNSRDAVKREVKICCCLAKS